MPMTSYFRPIVRTGSPRPADSILLAETEYWIGEAEEIKLEENSRLVSINDVPTWWINRWTVSYTHLTLPTTPYV